MPVTNASNISAMPDAGTYDQVSRVVDGPQIMADAIEKFRTQKNTSRANLANALVKAMSTAPLDPENAISQERARETNEQTLHAKIEAAEEVKKILEKYICDLNTTQPALLHTVIQTKVDELEAQMKVEHEETEVLKKQLKFLCSLLHDASPSAKKS